MSDFIAGALSSFTQLNVSHDNEYWRYIGIYAQDSWKINSRLTLNYGLRWEPYLNGTFHNKQVSHFIMQDFLNNVHSSTFPNAPAGTFYPGDSQFPTGSRPNKTSLDEFRAADWAGMGSHRQRQNAHSSVLGNLLRHAPHAFLL